MIKDGKRVKAVHNFPECFNASLNWASPELLAQVLQAIVYFIAPDTVSVIGFNLSRTLRPGQD